MNSETPDGGLRHEYEVWHDRLERGGHPDSPWHVMVLGRLIPARDLAGRRILEVGCGRGELASGLADLAEAPGRLIAGDFSIRALLKGSEGRHDEKAAIDWVQADIQQLPFGSEQFDTVISCETIEHTPSPRAAIRELSRVLKPGGRLFLTCPNYLNLLALYRLYLRVRGRRFQEAGQPLNRFLLRPIVAGWARAAGLRVVHLMGCRHVIPLWSGRAALVLESLDRYRSLSIFASQVLIECEKSFPQSGSVRTR